MVNLHFSLLPRWRGAAPVERAILAGDDRTGVCVMAVEEGLDTGGVYAVRGAASAPTTPPTSCAAGWSTLGSRAAGRHAAPTGSAAPTPQDGEPTYADKLDPAELRARLGRGRRSSSTGSCGSAGPGPRSGASASRCWRADGRRRPTARGVAGAAPGALDGTVVGTRRRARCELVEVQPEGKGRQDAAAWRNGARPEPGERLGRDAVEPAAAACAGPTQLRRRRARAHRRRRRLRQPRAARRCSSAAGSSDRDRAFVTELVYGTTRHAAGRATGSSTGSCSRPGRVDARAACCASAPTSWRSSTRRPTPRWAPPSRRAPKSSGAWSTPCCARSPRPPPVDWPDDAVRLSYPDWIVDGSSTDLGADDALAALEAMNEPPPVTDARRRLRPGPRRRSGSPRPSAPARASGCSTCAPRPGGKATAWPAPGATVVAADARAGRVGLVAAQRRVARPRRRPCSSRWSPTAPRPPFRPGSFDRVLVDAPCSGLGALRRRPDARWRIDADDVDRLAELQRRLLDAAARAWSGPGGDARLLRLHR